jgi:hypothetical protein
VSGTRLQQARGYSNQVSWPVTQNMPRLPSRDLLLLRKKELTN